MSLDPALQAILNRVPAWQGARNIQAQRLAGLTNVNYRVTVDDADYVLRISGDSAAHWQINRAHELAALEAAGAAGLAPEVAAFLPPEGHLVTRWVNGRHWTPDEFRTPARVRLLTDTVRRIHALPDNGATFAPFRRIDEFLSTAEKFGVRLPSDLERCRSTLRAVELDQQRDPASWRRFCHNDLASVNYLLVEQADAERLQVLDWEFSGLNDLFFDLATLVYTHDSAGPIPPDLEEVMLKSYFGAVNPLQRRRLLGMKAMLAFFTGAWALAQTGLRGAGLLPPMRDLDYLGFAEQHLAHEFRKLQAQYLQA